MKRLYFGCLFVLLAITILIIAVLVALNPVGRFRQARDAQRWNDVSNVLTAVHQYVVDNGGALPAGITTTEQQLGTDATGCNTTGCTGTAAACLDLSTDLAAYLKTMPIDPSGATDGKTYYKVVKDANNLVTVSACASEGGSPVAVSR
jgi:type II secretory pathway pseudopilin PulG